MKSECNNMHGERIEIVNAKQVKLYNNFKNTKCKLLRTNAATWFNKMCKIKQVKPGYIHIKINGRRQQNKKLQTRPSDTGLIRRSNFSTARSNTSNKSCTTYI
jgi:hypothetical protein